jgi:RNA polymerase sigma-70 factor (ECF subfamily)
VSLADGPHVGLAILATLDDDPRLERYQPLHATRAELLARSGDLVAATAAYRIAIELSQNPSERTALQARAARLGCELDSGRCPVSPARTACVTPLALGTDSRSNVSSSSSGHDCPTIDGAR